MRYYLDTEFNDYRGELISLALVPEPDGISELYVATACMEPAAWVAENVIPIIAAGCEPKWILPHEFGQRVCDYLQGDDDPVIVADWPDDIRLLCDALITGPGQMVDVPGLRFEMIRVDAYPTTLPGAVQHNALWDARALRHRLLGAAR